MDGPQSDPTQRFSNRVADYVRFRPRYPTALLDLLRTEMNLRPDHVMADVGSGTGFLSELFLAAGHHVIGIEPNAEMRTAGEQALAKWKAFTSIAGTAEATTLAAQTADFVVAGQAFHWFKPDEARREFQRILRPSGWVVLVWNDRKDHAAGVYGAYEKIIADFRLDAAADKRLLLTNNSPELEAFFAPGNFGHRVIPGVTQEFDFAALLGRLLSSSYAPTAGHPRHPAMVAALRQLFDEYETGGRIRFEHVTEVFYGQLGELPTSR